MTAGLPPPRPGDLDQVDHRLPRILRDAKSAPHRTLAKILIWQLWSCIRREPAGAGEWKAWPGMRADGLPELRKGTSGFSAKGSEAEANHRGGCPPQQGRGWKIQGKARKRV